MESEKAHKISGLVCKTLFCIFAACGLYNAIADNVAMTVFCCTVMLVTTAD